MMPTKYEVALTIELRYLEEKTFVTWYYICEQIWTLFADSHSQPEPGLSKDLGFFRNFGNPSNFDELYLRAQEIFFDGTGTVAKIYV